MGGESCYVYMGRGKLVRLYGKTKFVMLIWEQESCYVYMGTGKLLRYMGRRKLLRLYGKRKVVKFI
jgi:hypothetical protein